MLGKLTTSEIEEVLHHEVIGRIGCHNDEMMYVVPVSYAYDGDYIYSHAEEGLKVSIMRQNPRVCFQTDHMDNMANWKSVIAWGNFEELTDPEERKQALQKLMERNLPAITSETARLSPEWPFTPNDINNIHGIVYRVHLAEKTGRFEKTKGKTYAIA